MRTVGGEVIDTVDQLDRILVRYQDPEHPSRTGSVALERTLEARSISPKDYLWWQGLFAYWTPRGEPFRDKPIRCIGPLPSRPKP
jgi:hypothetical protein